MLTMNNRDFIPDWTPDATSTLMFLFENRHYFFSSLAYCPHVSGENDAQKCIFSTMLSRVEIFENTSFLFTCGWVKTEIFKYDDVIHHNYIINHISIVFNSVFMRTSENDLNTVCVDVYFFLIFKNIWIHVDMA